jgi:hypothetical protein
MAREPFTQADSSAPLLQGSTTRELPPYVFLKIFYNWHDSRLRHMHVTPPAVAISYLRREIP